MSQDRIASRATAPPYPAAHRIRPGASSWREDWVAAALPPGGPGGAGALPGPRRLLEVVLHGALVARLAAAGLEVPEQAIWTSALATARFLHDQRPGGSAYAIGESGLTTALHAAGYTLDDRAPDYVVLGETRTYSFERITRAIRLIVNGARFIATNPDATGPSPDGPTPATGSVAALISRATGVEPYYVGKPNPLMMRSALNAIDAHSETTAMIGDRMDTDVISGIEAGLETILVLTGISTRESAERFPYRPARIVDSVADLAEALQ